MNITTKTIKLFGQRGTVFQVIKDGEVVHVSESAKAAAAWIAQQ